MGAVAIVAIVARRRRAMRMLLLVHALRVDHGLLRKGADGKARCFRSRACFRWQLRAPGRSSAAQHHALRGHRLAGARPRSRFLLTKPARTRTRSVSCSARSGFVGLVRGRQALQR